MITEEKKEILEVLLANRYFLYSLFHKVFGRDPDLAMLEILTQEETKEAFGLLSEEPNDIMEKAGGFFEELKSDLAEPSFLDQVKSEYTKLFIGPIKVIAPPWESVYRGKEAMLFQESTLAVRTFYRKFNLIPEGYPHVADDSLALEMDFMSRLAKMALEDLTEENEEKLKHDLTGSNIFLQNHLMVWVPMFLKRMEDAPSDCLYPQMSLILDDFLKKDHQVLEEILQEL